LLDSIRGAIRVCGVLQTERLEIERPAKASVSTGSLRIEVAQRIRGFGREWRPGSRGPALVMQ